MNRAVFFDKDGTLIENVPYNIKPDLIILKNGTSEIVKAAKNAGYKIFVISNQSGVARGLFKIKDLARVWEKLEELCETKFDGFYFCPHLPNAEIKEFSVDCDCRKPKSGMLKRAAREHDIDLENSWMVGDDLKDVQAGNDAKCKTILLCDANAKAETPIFNERDKPDYVVKSLNEATQIIIENK